MDKNDSLLFFDVSRTASIKMKIIWVRKEPQNDKINLKRSIHILGEGKRSIQSDTQEPQNDKKKLGSEVRVRVRSELGLVLGLG